MKKLIPIFSLAITSVCLQNCANREENIMYKNQINETENTFIKRGDSSKTAGDTIDPNKPDPPVRDGDNWRKYYQ